MDEGNIKRLILHYCTINIESIKRIKNRPLLNEWITLRDYSIGG